MSAFQDLANEWEATKAHIDSQFLALDRKISDVAGAFDAQLTKIYTEHTNLEQRLDRLLGQRMNPLLNDVEGMKRIVQSLDQTAQACRSGLVELRQDLDELRGHLG